MSAIVKINLQRIDHRALAQAADVVKQGGTLLYPTDTIYGFGCDAFNDKAVRKVFEIKQRSEKNPALVLAHNRTMVKNLVGDIPPAARRLMDACWPGPLTIIFRSRKSFHPFITGEANTIGIRIPRNRFCLKLIAESGVPLLSTSANISGSPMISDVQQLIKTFSSHVDLSIDAGTLKPSAPSTVVDVTRDQPVIIREGAFKKKDIDRILNSRQAFV